MEFNPHSLHQILTRIREQMRCPQCGTRIDVDFPSIGLTGDTFMLLEVKCESCSSFIVLHVSLVQPATAAERTGSEVHALMNVSSTLSLSEDDMKTLRTALDSYEGSFEKLFGAFGQGTVA